MAPLSGTLPTPAHPRHRQCPSPSACGVTGWRYPMYKTIAVVAAGLFAVSPAIAAPAPTHAAAARHQATKPVEKSLYDRLGGIFAIAAVVDRFSDQIILNPKLNKNPALIEWNTKEAATRLPGLKFMRTLWVAALA